MSKLYENAFKALNLLEEEDFELSAVETDELKDFLDNDEEEETVDIIDPNADTEEEVKDSYIGNVVLECSVCHSMIYKDPSEVVEDDESEEDLVNVGEECPYCMSTDGYKIVGQIAPYETTDVTVEVEPKDDGDEEEDEVEVEDETEEVTESLKNRNARKSLKESRMYDLSPSRSSRKSFYGKAKVMVNDDGSETLYSYDTPIMTKTADGNFKRHWDGWSQTTGRHIAEFSGLGKKGYLSLPLEDDLEESLENLDIETEHDRIHVEAEEKVDDEEEMIVPIDPEVDAEIEENIPEDEMDDLEDMEDTENSEDMENVDEEELPGEDEEVDIEDFDEDSFDELGESFLRKTFSNVKSFNTMKITEDKNNNKLIIEGMITFKSGSKKPTTFKFTPTTIGKNNKVKFFGENLTVNKGKKAFRLSGRMIGNKLITESLTYNFITKNIKNESKRVSGTVKLNESKNSNSIGDVAKTIAKAKKAGATEKRALAPGEGWFYTSKKSIKNAKSLGELNKAHKAIDSLAGEGKLDLESIRRLFDMMDEKAKEFE